MTEHSSHIVSSSHLVSEQRPQMSDFEFGLTMANNAFLRWVKHCANAAGCTELNALDLIILHNVNHRDRAKKLADICFTLNNEDTHSVAYSLRKLVKQGLINSQKQGKETYYTTSDSGMDLCRRYKEIREQCLIASLKDLNLSNEKLAELASAMRTLSGFYDQASRAAASL